MDDPFVVRPDDVLRQQDVLGDFGGHDSRQIVSLGRHDFGVLVGVLVVPIVRFAGDHLGDLLHHGHLALADPRPLISVEDVRFRRLVELGLQQGVFHQVLDGFDRNGIARISVDFVDRDRDDSVQVLFRHLFRSSVGRIQRFSDFLRRERRFLAVALDYFHNI